jgi:hypothetical protein
MARRFDYRSTNEDGETNINKKSEIFTKLLPTTELVNSRDISQQYLDGKLVVKVAKL